jgi:hypothetical protein
MEMKESPFSKVTVSMPQITPRIGEKDYVGAFVARVEKDANVLVGRYNITKHNSYKGLWHGWINRIFELVGVICQPCPEPPIRKRKMKAPDVTDASPVAKMLRKKLGHDKKLLRTSFGTSTQELALAKPLCRGKKFASKPCGLSVAEKALIAGAVVGGKKVKRAVKLFGSHSSSEDDSGSAQPSCKHPQKSSTPELASKPTLAKG